MKDEAPQKITTRQPEFRGSLVRSVVLWMLALSLIPMAIMSGVNYLRSQALIKSQISDQVQIIVDNYTTDLNSYVALQNKALKDLVSDRDFFASAYKVITSAPNTNELNSNAFDLRKKMNAFLKSGDQVVFNEMVFVNPDGTILASTNLSWVGRKIAYITGTIRLLQTDASNLSYNPSDLFPELTLFSSKSYTAADGSGRVYTLVGVSTAPVLQNTILKASSFYPNARAYMFNQGEDVFGLSSTNSVIRFGNSPNQLSALHSIINLVSHNGTREYTSHNDQPVLAYARWMPELGMGLVLEIPLKLASDQIRSMGIFSLFILLAALVVTGFSVAFGATRVVTPLSGLAKSVQSFAKGEWNDRVKVNRSDEIGFLAHSFNLMAEELNQLYRSLESKVEERNQQLQTAAEVARFAVSVTDRQEILKRTVNLVTDRFVYDYAGIYLLDPSGITFDTYETSGRLLEALVEKFVESHMRTRAQFGSVIDTNRAQIIDRERFADNIETLLPGANSEVVLPISLGNQVLGVLDIQSVSTNAFNKDTITALMMVAGQVASGLQTISLIENAQVDLEETSLLYRASRQITQVKDTLAAQKILSDTISETSYKGMILEAQENQLRAVSIIDTQFKENTIPTIILTLSRILPHIEQKNYLVLDNLNQPSDFHPILSYFYQRGCKAVVLLPVFSGGKLSDLIALGSSRERSFTPAAVQSYLTLIEVYANTKERFLVMQSLENSVAELRMMATVSQAISVETDLEQVYKLLHAQLLQIFGGETIRFFIAKYNANTQWIQIPYIFEKGERIWVDSFPIDDGLASMLIQRRQSLLLSHNAFQQAAAMGARIVGQPALSWLGVPLILGNEVIGAMVIEDTEVNGRFGESDLHLFNILAPQVAVAIRNAELLTEMQQALKAYDQERFLLNTLLDNIPESIFFKDQEARFIRASRFFTDKHGLPSPEEVVGKTELDLTPGNPFTLGHHQKDLEIIASHQPQIDEVVHGMELSGKENWMLVSRLPMIDAKDQSVGMLGIFHDITDLKQTEQLAQHRAQQILTAAEIARDTSGTLDVNDLLLKSVNMVRSRFGFYHASIFLLDALNEFAVLRESTGEAGALMKNAGHKLAVGAQSIVGQATGRGEAVVVNDVTQVLNYYPNPMLPSTRSELAIPLKVGDRVLGALDVQSIEKDAFSAEDIHILRILADQLAIAIVNANLFVETEENIAKHRFLHQITSAAAACSNKEDALATTVQGLLTASASDRAVIYLVNGQNALELRALAGREINPTQNNSIPLGLGTVGLAALGKHPILVNDTQSDPGSAENADGIRSQLAIPILYTDRVVGVLCIESDRAAAYNEHDQEILGSLGSTLGAILANAELVSQVQQQVKQQKQLFDITSKIRRSTDIETILQTSAKELCTVLGLQSAQIRIAGVKNPPAVPAVETSQTTENSALLSSNGRNGHNGHKPAGQDQREEADR
jgi:PAS domain S-box-containing protein